MVQNSAGSAPVKDLCRIRPFWTYRQIADYTNRSVASVKNDANRRRDCPLRDRGVGGSREKQFPASSVEGYVAWLERGR